MPSVLRHGQGLTVKYSDYVRQDGHTIFVYSDRENGTVHLHIKQDNVTLYRQQLSPANADMIAFYLQQSAATIKP